MLDRGGPRYALLLSGSITMAAFVALFLLPVPRPETVPARQGAPAAQ
jgi:hypothetical protein